MRRHYYTPILLIIIVFTLSISSLSAAGGAPCRVVKVHDGDTVSIRAKSFAGIPITTERVRLIGVDAPELDQEPWGRISKRYLKKLLSESDWIVTIESDIEQRDQHGRLLAYLWDKKGRMINEQLLEAGYAQLYTFTSNVKYAERLAAAQKGAFEKKLGIWGKKGIKESPRRWRKEHPRDTNENRRY